DDNLLFVRERLLRSEAGYLPEGEVLAALLDLYRQVWSGKPVAADDTNPLIDLLRLSGVVEVRSETADERRRTRTAGGAKPARGRDDPSGGGRHLRKSIWLHLRSSAFIGGFTPRSASLDRKSVV